MKNKVVELNNVVAFEILYKGEKLLCYISREDLDKVSSIKGTWHINRNRSGSIDGVKTKIQVNGIRKQIWLHNVILEKSNSNNVVDHIDHNVLNNVRSNLREVSKTQNAQNISTTLKSTTKYRNVTMENNRYRVRIGGKSFGCYSTLEEAKQIARKERSKMFPITSELDNKNELLTFKGIQ